ncbi:MAG: hypothetical protein ACYTGQ_14375 [Planctomycetota bacterium]|jgi:hypothetical protein
MWINLFMAMSFLAQETTRDSGNAAAKEAGAFLMVALVAMGGAAILTILMLILMGRRLRKRKVPEDWRHDWTVPGKAAETDVWKAAAQNVSGEDLDEEGGEPEKD